MLFIVQAAALVAVIFFADKILGWVKDIDAEGVSKTVDKAWDFVNDHMTIVRIVLAVDLAAILLALVLAVIYLRNSRNEDKEVFVSPV